MKSKALLKIRIAIILIMIVSVVLIVMNNSDKDSIMIIGSIILGSMMLLATTRAYRIFQAIGVLITILFISVLSFEAVIHILRQNCMIVWCSAYTTEDEEAIAKYSEYLQSLYPDEEWVEPFSIELATIVRRSEKSQYYPYIEFRESPFEGEYAYVDSQGLRPIPQSECGENSYRVFTFGNSAMWGQYEPNHLTLAAHIQEELSTFISDPVCLINHAHGGWNFTQSLIQLINLIQKDDIPDLVIFYNGAIDIISSAQYQYPNIPLSTHEKAKEIGEIDLELPSEDNFYLWFKDTEIGSLILESNKPYTPTIPTILPFYLHNYQFKLKDNNLNPEDLYLENYDLVSSLANTYNFNYAVFVQPVSFYGDKPLTPKEEIDIRDGWLSDPRYAMEFQQTYPKLLAASEELNHLYFLGQLFDGMTEVIYGDPVHTLPNMNPLIAQEIGRLIKANNLLN